MLFIIWCNEIGALFGKCRLTLICRNSVPSTYETLLIPNCEHYMKNFPRNKNEWESIFKIWIWACVHELKALEKNQSYLIACYCIGKCTHDLLAGRLLLPSVLPYCRLTTTTKLFWNLFKLPVFKGNIHRFLMVDFCESSGDI